jgi:hypothetical protein
MGSKKIIVYSANIGGYDEFRIPIIYDPNIRYILFTDNKYFKSDVWEVNHVDFVNDKLDNRRKARYIKINPHIVLPNHDISIWVDHCFTPRFENVNSLINNIKFTNNTNIMIFNHSWRSCIYQESEEVLKKKLEKPDIVKNQMEKYKKEGFPFDLGLFETGFIVRRNNDIVNNFNNVWSNEVVNFSGRDQLSQMYSSWKTKVSVDRILFGKSQYDNPFLERKKPHAVKLRF